MSTYSSVRLENGKLYISGEIVITDNGPTKDILITNGRCGRVHSSVYVWRANNSLPCDNNKTVE